MLKELDRLISINIPFEETANIKKFESFMNNGDPPCDYERQLLENHEKMLSTVLDGKIVPPYEVEIQPSSSCNLACKHCFGKVLTNKNLPNGIGNSEMISIINKLNEFKVNDFKVETVKFCGTTGEPLVNPAIIPGIELLNDLGKEIIVFTNGLNLDLLYGKKKYLDYVLKTDKVNVSLDAGSEEIFKNLKGALGFERIVHSLEEMVSKRDSSKGLDPRLTVSYVIGTDNYGEIFKTAELMKKVGVDEIRYRVDFTNLDFIHKISPEIKAGLKGAEALDLKDGKFTVNSVYTDKDISKDSSAFNSKGLKCYNKHFWACIGPDANVYACGHKTYSGINPYGNILEKSFKDIWTSKERIKDLGCLTGEECKFCSPSSVRRNVFVNFLDELRKQN